LTSSESMVNLPKDRQPVGLSASRSVGFFAMDSSDWSNGIRYHTFGTRPDTEFKSKRHPMTWRAVSATAPLHGYLVDAEDAAVGRRTVVPAGSAAARRAGVRMVGPLGPNKGRLSDPIIYQSTDCKSTLGFRVYVLGLCSDLTLQTFILLTTSYDKVRETT